MPAFSVLRTVRRVCRAILISLGLGILLISFQNCSPSFQVDESKINPLPADIGGGPTNVTLDGRLLYTQNCSACHGSVDSSTKTNRSAYLIGAAIAEVPQMNAIRLSSQQLDAIASAITSQIAPNPEVPQSLFTCNPNQVSKTPLLRLTNREFRNSVNSLLDDFNGALKSDSQLVTLISAIPIDTVTQDRDTRKEQPFLNSLAVTLANFDVAFRASSLVSAHANGLQNYPGTSQCLGNSSITQTCHQNFVRELSRRAFRRPLSTSEVNSLAASLWSSSLSKATQIQTTVAAIIMMPEFGFKVFDQGAASNIAPNTREMTSHELASKLSFFLTGSPPDATLRGLAESGQILSNTVLNAQIDRLLALPIARDTVVRLFRESFGYDVFHNFSYATSFTNGINMSGLADAMVQELDNFFYDIVITRRGTFEDLFTATSTSISHSGLASLYGVSVSANNLASNRAGFLSRAAMLTKRAGFATSPIKRGLKVLEHVLCEEVGPPPPSAPTSLPVPTGGPVSTRDRTFASTEVPNTSCVGCHSKMNNLGYPFEQFDSLGRTRTTESLFTGSGEFIAQVPINTRVTTGELGSQPVTVTDAASLSLEIGRSDKAKMCFMKHLKRFEARMSVVSTDSCHMNHGLAVLYRQNEGSGAVVDVIKSFIMAPEFRRWSY